MARRWILGLLVALLVVVALGQQEIIADGPRNDQQAQAGPDSARNLRDVDGGHSGSQQDEERAEATVTVDGITVAASAPLSASSMVGHSSIVAAAASAAVADLARRNNSDAASAISGRGTSKRNKAAEAMSRRLYQQAEVFRQKAFEADSPHLGAAAILLYRKAAQVGAGRGSADAFTALARMFEFGWDGVGLLVTSANGQQSYRGHGFTQTQAALALAQQQQQASPTRKSEPLVVAREALAASSALQVSALRKAADASEAFSVTSAVLLVPPHMPTAVSFYLAGAALGNASAHFTVSLLHNHGLFGIEKSEVKALLHLYFAALGGEKAAQFSLGLRHATGLKGLPQSCSASVLYLQEPAAAAAAAVEESHGLLLNYQPPTHDRLNDETAGELWGSSSSKFKYLLHQSGLSNVGRLSGLLRWIKGRTIGDDKGEEESEQGEHEEQEEEQATPVDASFPSFASANHSAEAPSPSGIAPFEKLMTASIEAEFSSLGISAAMTKDTIVTTTTTTTNNNAAGAAASSASAATTPVKSAGRKPSSSSSSTTTDVTAGPGAEAESDPAAGRGLASAVPGQKATPGRRGRLPSSSSGDRFGFGLNGRRYNRRASGLKALGEPPMLPFYLTAADRGDLHAHSQLGHLFLLGFKGISRDLAKASEHFHAAAEGSDPMSMATLGFMYLHGLGVDGGTPDYLLAREFLQEPALQANIPAAQNDLAFLYLHGLGGVERNPQTAYDLFQKAAKGNYPEAHHNLGLMQLQGLAPAATTAASTSTTTTTKTTVTTTVQQSAQVSANGVVTIGGSSQGGAFGTAANAGLDGDLQLQRRSESDDAAGGAVLGQEESLLAARAFEISQRKRLLVRDYRGALQSFQAAAQHGHVPSSYRLGLMHLYGLGTGNNPDCLAAQRAFKNAVYRVTDAVFPFLENAKAAFADGNADAAFLSYLRASEIGLDVGTWNAAFLVHRGFVDEDLTFGLDSLAAAAAASSSSPTSALMATLAESVGKIVSLNLDVSSAVVGPNTLSPFRFLVAASSSSSSASTNDWESTVAYFRSLALRVLPVKANQWLQEVLGLKPAGNGTAAEKQASSSLLTESSGFSAPRSLAAQSFVVGLLQQSAVAAQNAHAELLLGDYAYWGLGGLVPVLPQAATSEAPQGPVRSAAAVLAARDRYLTACNGHVPQACFNLGLLYEQGYPPTSSSLSSSSSSTSPRKDKGESVGGKSDGNSNSGGGKVVTTGKAAHIKASALAKGSSGSQSTLPKRWVLDAEGRSISTSPVSGFEPVQKGDGKGVSSKDADAAGPPVIIERDQHLAKRYYDLCLEKQFQAIALGSHSATGANTAASAAFAAGHPNVAVVTAGRYSGSVLSLPVKMALWRLQAGNAWEVFRDEHLRPMLDIAGRKLMAVTPLSAMKWLAPASVSSRVIKAKASLADQQEGASAAAATSTSMPTTATAAEKDGGPLITVVPGEALAELLRWQWGDYLEALNEGANDPLAPTPTRPQPPQPQPQQRRASGPLQDAAATEEARDETSEAYRRLKHQRGVARDQEIAKLVTPLRYWAERLIERFLGDVTAKEWLDEVHAEADRFHRSIKSLLDQHQHEDEDEGEGQGEGGASTAAAPSPAAPLQPQSTRSPGTGSSSGGGSSSSPGSGSGSGSSSGSAPSLAERQSRRQQALMEAKKRRAVRAYEENVIQQFLQRCANGFVKLWDDLFSALVYGGQRVGVGAGAGGDGEADDSLSGDMDRVDDGDDANDGDGEDDVRLSSRIAAFVSRACDMAEAAFDASLAPIIDVASSTPISSSSSSSRASEDGEDDGDAEASYQAQRERRRLHQQAAALGRLQGGARTWPRWQKVLAVVFAFAAPLMVWDAIFRQRRRLMRAMQEAEEARRQAQAQLAQARPGWNQ